MFAALCSSRPFSPSVRDSWTTDTAECLFDSLDGCKTTHQRELIHQQQQHKKPSKSTTTAPFDSYHCRLRTHYLFVRLNVSYNSNYQQGLVTRQSCLRNSIPQNDPLQDSLVFRWVCRAPLSALDVVSDDDDDDECLYSVIIIIIISLFVNDTIVFASRCGKVSCQS